jgi:predicted DNA-binding ribbon-helix-helix protein
MVIKDGKNINIEINKECWKVLKKISIDKEITLQEVIKQILERFTNKKNIKED